MFPGIRILRPELFEQCRMNSAAHSSAWDAVESLAGSRRREARAHGLLERWTEEAGVVRRARILAAEAWRRAAHAGADLAEADRAAVRAVGHPPGPPTHRDVVLDPVPEDGRPRRLEELMVSTTGGEVRIATVDPDDLVPLVVTPGIGVYRHGNDHLVEVPWEKRVVRRDAEGRRHLYGYDIVDLAVVISARGVRRRSNRDVRDHHFYDALRHPDACPMPGRIPGDRDLKARGAEFAHHRLVCVGERFLSRCPEPTVSVRLTEAGTAIVRLDCSYSVRAAPGFDPPFMFRLDRVPEALAFAASTKGGRNADAIPDAAVPGEGLRFDDDLWNVRAAAAMVVDRMDGRIALLSDGEFEAFLRVRDHVAAWGRDSRVVSDDPAAVSAFLADAGTVAAALFADVMEDILPQSVADLLDVSLSRSVARCVSPRTAGDMDDEVIADMRF